MSSTPPTSPNAAVGDSEKDDGRSALTRAFFPDGSEPDPRFTLANERTFLAWTRTSLAFLAAGVALEAFPINGLSEVLRTALAIVVLVVGVFIAGGAAMRWLRVERAMRRSQPLPAPAIVPFLSAAALGAGVTAIILFLGF